MADAIRDLLRSFEGPRGKAEVFEVIMEPGRMGVEKVEYEVVYQGQSRTVGTMGEAAILATELTGGS